MYVPRISSPPLLKVSLYLDCTLLCWPLLPCCVNFIVLSLQRGMRVPEICSKALKTLSSSDKGLSHDLLSSSSLLSELSCLPLYSPLRLAIALSKHPHSPRPGLFTFLARVLHKPGHPSSFNLPFPTNTDSFTTTQQQHPSPTTTSLFLLPLSKASIANLFHCSY